MPDNSQAVAHGRWRMAELQAEWVYAVHVKHHLPDIYCCVVDYDGDGDCNVDDVSCVCFVVGRH